MGIAGCAPCASAWASTVHAARCGRTAYAMHGIVHMQQHAHCTCTTSVHVHIHARVYAHAPDIGGDTGHFQ
eukprot:4188001-Prymnesium_polylepis.2